MIEKLVKQILPGIGVFEGNNNSDIINKVNEIIEALNALVAQDEERCKKIAKSVDDYKRKQGGTL